jgi:hypothetical protein
VAQIVSRGNSPTHSQQPRMNGAPGTVRVNSQEWSLEIKKKAATKFGAVLALPLIRKQHE